MATEYYYHSNGSIITKVMEYYYHGNRVLLPW